MKNITLKGTITALVTPFHEDLEIDFGCLKRLIDFQIECGTDAIVICGSTGEGATLSEKEKVALFVQSVEYSAGRVPIIAGTGSNDTRATISLTNLAKELGTDAVLLVAPYYNKPTQEGIYQHYMAISESVDIPQIIYNVPGRTGVNISAETQLRIIESCKNVVATKEASGDLEQMMQIIKYAPEGFSVISGDDALALPLIAMGGKGVVSVISNYAPKQFGECINAALDGKWAKATKLHYSLFDLMQLNFIETNPVPAKTAMSLMGMTSEIFRLPLIPIKPENRVILKNALISAGLLKKRDNK